MDSKSDVVILLPPAPQAGSSSSRMAASAAVTSAGLPSTAAAEAAAEDNKAAGSDGVAAAAGGGEGAPVAPPATSPAHAAAVVQGLQVAAAQACELGKQRLHALRIACYCMQKQDICGKLDALSAQECTKRGRACFQEHHYAEARFWFSEALIKQPGTVGLLYNRASASLKLEEPLPALEDCLQLLRAQPGYELGWFKQAEALAALKQYSAAIASLQQVQPAAAGEQAAAAADGGGGSIGGASSSLSSSRANAAGGVAAAPAGGASAGAAGPSERAVTKLLKTCQAAAAEKEEGRDDFLAMHKAAAASRDGRPRLQHQDYWGPVAVGDVGEGRGRGLVATADISPGQLLLVSKAVEVAYIGEGSSMPTLDGAGLGKMNSPVQAQLKKALLDRVAYEPEAADLLLALTAGKGVNPGPIPAAVPTSSSTSGSGISTNASRISSTRATSSQSAAMAAAAAALQLLQCNGSSNSSSSESSSRAAVGTETGQLERVTRRLQGILNSNSFSCEGLPSLSGSPRSNPQAGGCRG